MSTQDYIRKRKFDRTPEPAPKPATAAGGSRFCIQRHHARRLHYDLRLEVGGVLKSWAVPRGPTLDPTIKRLAVEVEDHPLEYGDFEGSIPEGNYGAGAVTLWDKGTYEVLGDKSVEQQLERGDLKFSLHGEKLAGEFALVRVKSRGKQKEWLLIKKKDFAVQAGWDAENDIRSVKKGDLDPALVGGAVKSPIPHSAKPALATASAKLPEGADWIYELKWDGIRALVTIEESKVRLVSRTGKIMDKQYPELSGIAQHVAADTAILDGEIVAFDEQGKPSFGHLQSRITALPSAAKANAATTPVTLFVFDLLYLNGYVLRPAPLLERKRLLAGIIKPNPIVRVSDHFAGSGQQLLQFAREHGLEGVMAKRALSPYESRRTSDWLKIKIVAHQDFVVCGFSEGERDGFGSLVLGSYENGKLVYVGNVGSGFDQASIDTVRKLLKPLITTKLPFESVPDIPRKTHWVKPELVCAVKFSSWTHENRLRAPVFLGMRMDVEAADCVREVEDTAPLEDKPKPEQTKLLSPSQKEAFVDVEGKRLKFTNLGKVFYPQEGYTKRDVINYYDAVAPLILPYLKDRPLSLRRYPDGITREGFFQKQAAESFAPWVRTEPVFSEHNQAPIDFVICNDRATLLYLANLGCIDQNPWMSRIGSLESPDFILIDLDPHDCEYDRIVEAALLVRKKLELVGLEGYPKTTGGDGMHIDIPVEAGYTYDQTRVFAEILARLLENERPDLFTLPRAVSRREKGKVYFDYLQNGEGKTISAPYVLRAYPGAPVSTPLRWNEVRRGLLPTQFHLGNVLDRFARLGDIFSPMLTNLQKLEPALEKLEGLVKQKL